LPDAVPSWKVAITGAFFTGLLFTVGKIIILTMLPFRRLNSVFGASTSIVLLLLFLFYSSFIFYYGPAAFLYAGVLWASYRSHVKGKIAWKGREYSISAPESVK